MAPTALGGVKGAVLEDNLTLADHHHRTTAHFCALKDVVLHVLEGKSHHCKKLEQLAGAADARQQTSDQVV